MPPDADEELSAAEGRETNLRNFLRGVPRRYVCATMADLAGVAMPGDTTDLLVTGKPGRGKTHAAVAWVASRIEREGWVALWYEVPILLARFRASFRDGAKESELDIIAELEAPGIVLLDDLGAEKSSDYSAQSLYCILSRRVNECKTTVITTNLTLSELHAAEPRIASRLAGFHQVNLGGDDWRAKRHA